MPLTPLFATTMLTLAIALPTGLRAGEVAPPRPVPAGPPWQQSARELLPYLPERPLVAMAVDWEHLLRHAGTLKPTSVLRDADMGQTLAHVREQLRSWAQSDPGMPDLDALLRSTRAAVFAITAPAAAADAQGAPGNRMILVADVGAAAPTLQRYVTQRFGQPAAADPARPGKPPQPASAGPFVGHLLPDSRLVGFSGTRIAMADAGWLKSVAAGAKLPPPERIAAPLWLDIDFGQMLAGIAALEPAGEDVFGFSRSFGEQWRTSRSRFQARITPGAEHWHGAATWSGLIHIPTRAPSLAVSTSVPPAALASLVVGLDPAWMAKQVAAEIPVGLFDVGKIIPHITGDVAFVLLPDPALPRPAVVLGIKPTARAALGEVLVSQGWQRVPPAAGAAPGAAWIYRQGAGSGPAMPEVLLTEDRLVAGTGDNRTLTSVQVALPVLGHATLTIDLAQVAKVQLRGWGIQTEVWGAIPLFLTSLQLGPQPPLDVKRWLPPLEVMSKHLPLYRMGVSTTPSGLTLVEEGIPLAAGVIYAAVSRVLSDPATAYRRRTGAMTSPDDGFGNEPAPEERKNP